ncbi:MAG: hypothetical protein WCR55_00840 [Lentisphaerota bacterium]
MKKFFILVALTSALLFSFSLSLPASIEINTATGTIDAQFSIFNISGYPLSFKYNPEISKGSVGAKWETSLDANLQLSDEVPIFTISAYCSKILFIKNEDGKFESGGGLGAKFEFINGDYTLTSNIGEKLTFDDKGNLKTIQDESGSVSVMIRNPQKLISGWGTKSDRVKTFSIDNSLTGGSNSNSNEDAKVDWNLSEQISAIKANREYKFSYTDSILSSILINGNTSYLLEYNDLGLLSRLKEPDHDYALSYYENGKILSIDDARGDTIYVEYSSDTKKEPDTSYVYVWNITQATETQYKYTKDKVEIKEGPIDSDKVLFGTIDRKTGIRKSHSITGDTMEIVPGKDASFTVNASLVGFTPYQMNVDFGNIVLKNKNGIEYFKDIISVSDLANDNRVAEIKNNGIIRDSNKNIIGIIYNGIQILKNQYSLDGTLLEKTTTASGNETLFTYDTQGRIIKSVNSLGNTTSYRYMKDGLEIIYPDGASSSIKTDEYNLPTEVLDPLGKKTIFDYQGLPARRSVELCGFDNQSYIQSKENDISSFSSSLFGVWLFLNNKDLSIARISPDSTITNYYFDSNHKPLAIKDKNNKILSSYSFNKHFQITDAQTDSCRMVFEYDDYGRLSAKNYNKELSIHLNYDQIDMPKEISDSSGFALKYGKNTGGKITSISSDNSGIFKITYYDSGMIKNISYPNGIIITWNYDIIDRITEYIINFPDGSKRDSKLKYDKVGNLIEINTNGSVVNYSYDALGHLEKISDSNGKSVNLKFDIWGNLMQLGNNKSKGVSPALLSEINSVALAYTQTSAIESFSEKEKKTELSYDWDNRVSEISFGPNSKLSIAYAPLEDQIYTADADSKQKKYYFLYDNLYATWDSESKCFTRYIYLPNSDTCLAIIRPNGKPQYVLCDVFGSITDLTDNKGKLLSSRSFNSLGILKTQDDLNVDTFYGGMIGFDKGNIIFSEGGPVLLKSMRLFGPQSQKPGNIALDSSNKLSFMEEMPLTRLNEKNTNLVLGVNSRQL